jgi:hypothetical protein
MPRTTFFLLECPICGRTLQVRVEYLGRTVACVHCRGEFPAADPNQYHVPDASGVELLRRADELLDSVEEPWPRPR